MKPTINSTVLERKFKVVFENGNIVVGFTYRYSNFFFIHSFKLFENYPVV